MACLGIPPIYHHLYDFGNVPVFVSLGKKYRVNELSSDGKVVARKYMDYTVVTDERICDGFYFASALRYLRGILQDPGCLDEPAPTVVPVSYTHLLSQHGAFLITKSGDKVAKYFGISKYTLYSYIDTKQEEKQHE